MRLPQSAICAIPAIATAALPRVPYQTHLGGYGSQLLIGLRLFVRLSSQLIRSCHSAIGQSRPAPGPARCAQIRRWLAILAVAMACIGKN